MRILKITQITLKNYPKTAILDTNATYREIIELPKNCVTRKATLFKENLNGKVKLGLKQQSMNC